MGYSFPGINYILHILYFNSSLEGISPTQWQDFICSRFFFYQLLTLHQENRISPTQWQGFICSGIYFCQLLTLHQENWIFPPQWEGFICPRIYFYQTITLHQGKMNFSNPVAGLHLKFYIIHFLTVGLMIQLLTLIQM